MNKLYRSRSNTMVAGVCGGLGEYLGIDPTLVRLVFVLLTVISGVGLLLYLILLILMPRAGSDLPAAGAATASAPMIAGTDTENAGQTPAPTPEGKAPESRNVTLFLGIGLIIFGAAYLLRNLDFKWFRWLGWHTLWPLVLIAIGLAVLIRPAKGE